MKSNSFFSNKFKLLGNILVLISIILLLNRFFLLNITFANFYSKEFLVSLFLAIFIQTFLILLAFYPWKVFIEILSDKKLPIIDTLNVFVRTNIYKYIPGNVLQYIGRNQLAIDMKISHFNVAFSTFLDLIFSTIFIFLASIILLKDTIFELVIKFVSFDAHFIYLLFSIILLFFLILLSIFHKKIDSYFSRFTNFLKKKNILKLFSALLYYCFNAFLYLFIYFIILKIIIGDNLIISEQLKLTGAFAFSWVVGTITPGAPGGVGIREAMMIYISGDKYSEEMLVFIVLMRIATTLADIFAFLIGNFVLPKIFNQNNKL